MGNRGGGDRMSSRYTCATITSEASEKWLSFFSRGGRLPPTAAADAAAGGHGRRKLNTPTPRAPGVAWGNILSFGQLPRRFSFTLSRGHGRLVAKR